MYRSNIQSKVVEEELRTHEVPYVMYGGQQFFERKEVKDLIAYLRVALNPRDELAIRRVLNYPAAASARPRSRSSRPPATRAARACGT